jgi:hypothetical protein
VRLLGVIGPAFAFAWKIAMAVHHFFRDRKVFRYIKTTKVFGSLYNVEEIATALRRTTREVTHSLRRLKDREKVRSFDGGLWGLHEFER